MAHLPGTRDKCQGTTSVVPQQRKKDKFLSADGPRAAQRSAQRTKAVAHTGISTPLAKNAKQRTPNCERDLRFPKRANPALSAA
jgi:hypothetical protein